MNEKSYYVDSCIYLNLWKKEYNKESRVSYWKLAKEFFQRVEDENATIYYSGYLLKELSFILDKQTFIHKSGMFENSHNFKRIALSLEEHNLAKEIETETNFEISFYDIIHMLLTKKTNSTLITRDKKLISTCKKYNALVKTPEEIL